MVDEKKIKETLASLRETNKKKFSQTVELIVILKDIDIKKQPLDFFTTLNHERGRKMKICALVGPELSDESKKVFDRSILQTEFSALAGKKREIKNIASEFDFFVAQADIMANVATVFGRILGPKGKMPNPKAGCVVPPKTNLQPVYNRLKKTVRIQAKISPVVQIAIGKEDQPEAEVLDNITHVYTALIQHLPQHINNIKGVYLKLTMSPSVKVM